MTWPHDLALLKKITFTWFSHFLWKMLTFQEIASICNDQQAVYGLFGKNYCLLKDSVQHVHMLQKYY